MFSTLCVNFRMSKSLVLFCIPTRSVRKRIKFPTPGFNIRSNNEVAVNFRNRIREFHTTNRRDIPPLLALILQPALRIGSFLFGRTIRKWWRKKDVVEREKYKSWVQNKKPYLLGILGATATMILVYYFAHIENTAITNRPRFIMFTKQQQAAFAKMLLTMQLEQYQDKILPKSHPAYDRLMAVTDRLLSSNKDLQIVKEKQWSLTVVDAPVKNAFVLPGGNIFVFTGILQMIENDDQLTVIIGHEMAHALLKHSMEQVSKGFIVDVLLVLPILIIWALFPDVAATFIHLIGQQLLKILHDLPYSRSLETEADQVGLMLAAKTCIDVREAVVFWGMMRALENLGTESGELSWLSTHPNHEDREKTLNTQMPEAIALRSSHKCPGLNPIDPRKKFYERSPKELEARFKQRGVM